MWYFNVPTNLFCSASTVHELMQIISIWACFQFPAGPGTEAESEAWVNALLGRIFWDFLREKYWADMVSKKIQMKLSKIRVCFSALVFLRFFF